MEKKKSKFTIYRIVGIAIMAALVFVSSNWSIQITLANDQTRIHLGNIFCLLAGFLLGPVGGGLAAGIGSCFFDLLNPLYMADAPITFINKFLLAYVCAIIAYKLGKGATKVGWNFVAAVGGSLTYIILYLSKTFIQKYLIAHNEYETVMFNILSKLGASSLNALIAVLVSVPFFMAIRSALKAAKLDGKLY